VVFGCPVGLPVHLNGEIPIALGKVADELPAAAADIRTVEVLAVK